MMINNNKTTIAIVDDDVAMRESLSDYFNRSNYIVKAYDSGLDMLKDLNNCHIDVIICDLKMPSINGLDVIKQLKLKNNPPPIIIITAYGNIPTAVEAIQNGAYDFIEKPFNPKDLKEMVDSSIINNSLSVEETLLGKSIVMQQFRKKLLNCAKSNKSILITGELGVNKILIAKVIHKYSPQSSLPFVHINCNSISEQLMDKIFLGKGGVFDKTGSGILFLYNLNNLPINGINRFIKIFKQKTNKNLRIICSIVEKNDDTNYKNKEYIFNTICEKQTREIIKAPTLRERKEDIFELFNLYLNQSSGEYRTFTPTLSEKDIIALLSFNWPKNQSQLKQIAEKFVLLNRTTTVSIAHLLKVSGIDISNMEDIPNKNLRILMQNFERQLITQAMIECSGNITQVCELLKTPRRTLNEKLLKHELHRLDFLQK